MSIQNLILGILRNSPQVLLRRLAGPALEIDGNRLDANIQIIANMAAAEAAKPDSKPPATVQEWRAGADAFDPMGLPLRRGVRTQDIMIDGDGFAIKARVYAPPKASDADPAILFFHQGGLVVMHHLTDDHFCSVLADECSAKVISVDYRLCPEVAFPMPIEDGLLAWAHVQQNAEALGIDPRRVALAGDSAGGLICATMTQILRDRGGLQPAAQLLAYPWVATDLESGGSMESCKECFPLSAATMEFFNETVFPGQKGLDHPYANPLHNKDLQNLPPAIIGTAGFDPIRDQGNAYADALKAAGNQVKHYCFSELSHSYLVLGRISHAAERAGVQMAQELARFLGR